MRTRISNNIFSRIKTSGEKDYQKIYHIACEGEKTEVHYFEEIEKNKKRLKISEKIVIDPMSQNKNNPEGLLVYLIEKKKEEELDDYELCLVVDRDPESFTEKQFDRVLKGCKENKINLAISNPCFEIWLLLHFDDCKKNKDKSLKNKSDYLIKKITEKLKSINHNSKGYKKNSIKSNFEYFVGNIDNAINNAKQHEVENRKLKNSLGTSVGELVEKILKSVK